LEVYRATGEVRQRRQDQQLVLAINRSDYMLDAPSSTLMQVPSTAFHHSKVDSVSPHLIHRSGKYSWHVHGASLVRVWLVRAQGNCIVHDCRFSEANVSAQVELNTIASSFGCLSTQVSHMHKYILERSSQQSIDLDALPPNSAMEDIADALGACVAEYGVPGAVVVFVVQPNERNSYDQQVLTLPING